MATPPAGSELITALVRAGVCPVRMLEVADGEDYGEVARRLISRAAQATELTVGN